MNNKALAPVLSEMYRSPDSKDIFTYSPGICALENGRLIGTLDIMGPGVERIDGSVVFVENPKRKICGKVFVSDDNGESWQFRSNFPFIHARPFTAGNSLYIIGHNTDLYIMRSDDGGETWGEAVRLTENEEWHQAPANVCYANGNVYLVMEKYIYRDCKGWSVSTLAPVLMRARVTDDLTRRESWSFAESSAFRDVVDIEKINYFAVPFYKTKEKESVPVCEGAPARRCAPAGWLETNVVHFENPEHIWCDPSGHTFHLWMRLHSGGTGYAAIMKVVEQSDGSMKLMTEQAPSGKDVIFVPCPGGQMKFHILYDGISGLFWLLSTQSTDSMIRPEMMDPKRFDLPNNERQRLVLHFSKNCIDWCFAGLVDKVSGLNMSRHYASMAINGDDLIILSRSGDEEASTAHNGNVITCHRIKNFRELVY